MCSVILTADFIPPPPLPPIFDPKHHALRPLNSLILKGGPFFQPASVGTNRAASCKMLFEKNYFAALLRQEREREIHAYPLLPPSLPPVGRSVLSQIQDPPFSVRILRRNLIHGSRIWGIGPSLFVGRPTLKKAAQRLRRPLSFKHSQGSLRLLSLSLCADGRTSMGSQLQIPSIIPPLPTKDYEWNFRPAYEHMMMNEINASWEHPVN